MKPFFSNIFLNTIIQLIVIAFLVSCQDFPPTVKTISATLVTDNSIEVKGQILNNGGKDVYSFGFCISEDTLPTQNDMFYDCITPTTNLNTEFTHQFTDLKVNTFYHIRAYAINNEGISYGEDIKIKTLAKALVTTQAATNITLTEATLHAFIDPLNSTTENWFEYWTEGESIKSTDAIGTSGNISSKITGLTPNKVYQVVAKAQNERGITQGEISAFETYAVTDFDGNLYHTVTIGNQTWLRENFKGTHFLNGDPIANITDQAQWEAATSPAYCYYNNDPEIGKVYGALYNWYTASDSRGLISGFHTPTLSELGTLTTYLGGSEITGGKLKEVGFTHWIQPNKGATNSTNFTGLPGGARTNYGGFTNLGDAGAFWTSTNFPISGAAYSYDLGERSAYLGAGGNSYYYGFSLRLVKN